MKLKDRYLRMQSEVLAERKAAYKDIDVAGLAGNGWQKRRMHHVRILYLPFNLHFLHPGTSIGSLLLNAAIAPSNSGQQMPRGKIMFHETSHVSSYPSSEIFNDCSEVVDTSFGFAFQPMVEIDSRKIFGYEALVRGLAGESAATVIEAIRPENRYFFDQACRMRALKTAARRGIDAGLHINCSQISPENLSLSIDATVECALEHRIDPGRIVLEFGNLEMLGNPRQLNKAREIAHAAGLRVLADNVGQGEVGLKRVAVFNPDFAKLDRSLICGIDTSARRQAIVQGLIATCKALGIAVIATGIERKQELAWLEAAGVKLAQGFLFGRPSTSRSIKESKVA